MRSIPFTIQDETYEEQRKAGRYNPANVMRYNRRNYTLSCGDSDDVYAYAEGKGKSRLLYVVSLNRRYDYVGLQFFGLEGQEVGSIFCQGEEHYCDILGPKGLDLMPYNIAKSLRQYCDY